MLYGKRPLVVTVFVQCSVRAFGTYENVHYRSRLWVSVELGCGDVW